MLGFALFLLPIPWELPELIDEPILLKRITEFGVIVALVSAGLKIKDPFSWKTWRLSARLLLITMPRTIAATAFLGWWVAGLVPASAILSGAVLAPLQILFLQVMFKPLITELLMAHQFA